MSIQEQLEEFEDEIGRLDENDFEEMANKLVKRTLPGRSNEDIIEYQTGEREVVERVVEDLNNWFEIIYVKTLPDGNIGMPMEYRWSIIRWANEDMDQWLMDNGWDDNAHLFADTREREVNELEARYAKEFGDRTVYANFLVEFPEIVFRRLNDRAKQSVVEDAIQKREKSEKMQKIKRRLRS